MNLQNLKIEKIDSAKVQPEAESPYVTEVLYYPTYDGKKFPISVTRKKNLKLYSSQNFGLIRLYGGFNMIDHLTPDEYTRVLLDRGGFLANVIIRGGGEQGSKEWKSAYGKNRIKSFEDVNAGAEFLIRKGYGFRKKIAINGRSNGGLTVLGAVMLRPDLYGAVVSESPVTDLLNAEKLDSDTAKFWAESDYGNLKDPEVSAFWKKHSPYEALADVENLPPILLRTAQDDPNVSPLHSIRLYKKLYYENSKTKHGLIVLPPGYSHGPSTVAQRFEEYSYFWSFILRAMEGR